MINELFYELVERNPKALTLFLDHDGSLAPIVESEPDAFALPKAVEHLRKLVKVLGRIVIISGRPVSYLLNSVPVDGLTYAGLYGFEVKTENEVETDDRVKKWSTVIDEVASEAERMFPELRIEKKNNIAVSIYWRGFPEREVEVRTTAAELAAKFGLHAPDRAQQVVELRPPLPTDKGTVVEQLRDRTSTMIAYVGDDLSDVPAFRAVQRLAISGQIETGVRIAVRSPHVPIELIGQADMAVYGSEGVVQILDDLASRLKYS